VRPQPGGFRENFILWCLAQIRQLFLSDLVAAALKPPASASADDTAAKVSSIATHPFAAFARMDLSMVVLDADIQAAQVKASRLFDALRGGKQPMLDLLGYASFNLLSCFCPFAWTFRHGAVCCLLVCSRFHCLRR
jgi:hypothetical protein